ncbi:anthranilate phosphoribosyltransferase [Alkalimarinus sediminis]|uniref:Anthranilate phosphoribosyltransferase n=1 Tax=Alkalimarinus sediminis TaxID=1632866 RepID=A0A9E8KPP9_9ALTE|nr:anthranilate phosphoribosyltransferase [Alkalimarinus sediminis]UZW74405.1 anthranilate phosphoribosyltransferase [Alkalimarinus sediminis]
MDIKAALNAVVDHRDLSTEEMQAVMQQIMTGQATDSQIGGFLIGLRMKGESINEITGAAQVMRELATKVDIKGEHLVDTCGTGGDGSNLFNVSTASAFVVAAAGGQVAKHGNRSVSSSTGSADVLEAAGINLNISAEHVARCVDEIGVGFMFAPAHHSAMKHAIGPRKEMGLRTIFNMLGPMTNPAGVKNQVIGVFSQALCRPMAEVLKRLGSEHVLIVHSADGLDEISIANQTHIAELKNGEITEYTIKPEDFNIKSNSLIGLSVDSAQQSLTLIKAALGKDASDNASHARDIITLNAGAAIYAANLADSLGEGVDMAADAIGSGLALAKINDLASFTTLLKD